MTDERSVNVPYFCFLASVCMSYVEYVCLNAIHAHYISALSDKLKPFPRTRVSRLRLLFQLSGPDTCFAVVLS